MFSHLIRSPPENIISLVIVECNHKWLYKYNLKMSIIFLGDIMFKIDKKYKSANISRTVRFTEELFEELNKTAQENNISFNYYIITTIKLLFLDINNLLFKPTLFNTNGINSS